MDLNIVMKFRAESFAPTPIIFPSSRCSSASSFFSGFLALGVFASAAKSASFVVAVNVPRIRLVISSSVPAT
jgi:hypothetical protein